MPLKYGGRFRNHCPYCLFSLHVDRKKIGDRKSLCQGLMEPVGYFKRKTGEIVLVHSCRKCKAERFNRIAYDDNMDKILSLKKVARRKGVKKLG